MKDWALVLFMNDLFMLLVDYRLVDFMNDFSVLFMDHWLVNLCYLLFVNDWLMMFMNYLLMMLMDDFFMMLMQDLLMMLMNYVFMMLLYNGLRHLCLDSGCLGMLDDALTLDMSLYLRLFVMPDDLSLLESFLNDWLLFSD